MEERIEPLGDFDLYAGIIFPAAAPFDVDHFERAVGSQHEKIGRVGGLPVSAEPQLKRLEAIVGDLAADLLAGEIGVVRLLGFVLLPRLVPRPRIPAGGVLAGGAFGSWLRSSTFRFGGERRFIR